MVPLQRVRFLVVHLYSSFSMDPLGFFLGENFYKKLQFLAILAAVRPHFQSHKNESYRDCGDVGDPAHAKFCKNCLRGYTPLGQLDTKNYQFL